MKPALRNVFDDPSRIESYLVFNLGQHFIAAERR